MKDLLERYDLNQRRGVCGQSRDFSVSQCGERGESDVRVVYSEVLSDENCSSVVKDKVGGERGTKKRVESLEQLPGIRCITNFGDIERTFN